MNNRFKWGVSDVYRFFVIVMGAFLLPLLLFSCNTASKQKSQAEKFKLFGNTKFESEFWDKIDTAHVLIASERYSQAKVKILEAREFAEYDLHFEIMDVVSEKIKIRQRDKSDDFSKDKSSEGYSDPYLRSNSPADIMLAYNYVSGYVKGSIQNWESIKFPKALRKINHVELEKGVYRINSYFDMVTDTGETMKVRFYCEIKLLKDRRNYAIQSLDISL